MEEYRRESSVEGLKTQRLLKKRVHREINGLPEIQVCKLTEIIVTHLDLKKCLPKGHTLYKSNNKKTPIDIVLPLVEAGGYIASQITHLEAGSELNTGRTVNLPRGLYGGQIYRF